MPKQLDVNVSYSISWREEEVSFGGKCIVCSESSFLKQWRLIIAIYINNIFRGINKTEDVICDSCFDERLVK